MRKGKVIIMNQGIILADALNESLEAQMAIFSNPIWMLYSLIGLIAMCIVFKKAGEFFLAPIIPIYNLYVWAKVSMGKGWMFLLLFIPIVNIVIALMMVFGLAKAFGKGTLFGLGLLILSPVFMSILAFSKAEYQGR